MSAGTWVRFAECVLSPVPTAVLIVRGLFHSTGFAALVCGLNAGLFSIN
jgi:hypothetical protein